MKHPENQIIVIFGASGDLSKRKLYPALFNLFKQNLLPLKFAVIGVGRSEYDDGAFRIKLGKDFNTLFPGKYTDDKLLKSFLERIFYVSIDTFSGSDYAILRERIMDISVQLDIPCNIIYYLATPPNMYTVIPGNLHIHSLNESGEESGWKRIIVEKPFGTDLDSARKLNKELLNYFTEEQIYRIDHYLGKETVQNVLVTRFSNGIFEPLWNRNYIHHVEITAAESLGIEDRAGYYDQSGALRDMVQNHLMQLVGLVAMEPPISIEAESIRNETNKVFRSLRPITVEMVKDFVIRGQYTASTIKGVSEAGYRDANGVQKGSKTETFVAMKFFIDNWRWSGVPFYIRTGKKLPARVTEIVIHFNKTPHHIFRHDQQIINQDNQLVIRIQPDEGILLKFGMKVPGAGFKVQTVNMDFHYNDLKNRSIPDAYERLLHDCMMGDATLYARGDSVEIAWEFIQPILQAWNTMDIPVYGYPAGTWGPDISDQLIEGDNMTWRYPCKNLSNDGEYCEL